MSKFWTLNFTIIIVTVLQICLNIRKHRELKEKERPKDWTQAEMAKKLSEVLQRSITRSTYRNWEESTEPELSVIKAIAAVFEIPEWKLLEGIIDYSKAPEKKSGSTNLEPDRELLTQIENHANAILLSLRVARSKPRAPLGPGKDVVPGSVRMANTSDRKKKNKKQEGN